ncbi:uncharacterized protein L201_001384 [Kwoniella dendrophila CBS 6074]|uniref:SP-RING-type domain-containing protein n=1 Tax=Kwoniella dendrophila CBS 6074 TaxID=1295534 RepID=A0AAX4JM99_9TREE
MASQVTLQTDWSDYQWFVSDYVPKQTVATLRLFASIIEQQSRMACYVRSSDRKADIVSRVQDCFARMKAQGDIRGYGQCRLACEQRGVAQWKPHHVPAPTFGGVPSSSSHQAQSSSSYARPTHASAVNGGYGNSHNNAGPSRAGSSNWSTSYNRPPPTLQDWKPNPMWKPIRALTSMEMLPDISHNENSHVRRERKTNFSIPNEVIEKLNYTRDHLKSHPRYAIRLFCTSSDHYKPPGMPALPGQPVPTNKTIPIEYPSNPDIMVDSYPLSFKEKGLRGKAGSAPPFDLEKTPNGLSRVPGRMTTITMGHSGPTVGKKKDVAKRFFYQIVFTEITTKDELLNRLKGLIPTSVEASLAEFKKRQEEDDDIVVGTSVMSLKDPLAYMRMTRPVRSSKCTHIQCFDAQWWIESNAQHPQWHCPHCGKELQFPELIVDGYVMAILNACPDSVDDVVLEPSGDWHTEDNKYGSAAWMATHGVAAPLPAEKKADLAPTPQSNGTPVENTIPKRKIVELLSDSEDEDEQPLSRTNGSTRPSIPPLPAAAPPRLTPAPTPAAGTTSSARSSIQPANEIIDLTISDSEDEDEDDAEEPPSASQTYFQKPDAEYTNRSAVDSIHPHQSLNNQNKGTAVRSTLGDNNNDDDDFMSSIDRLKAASSISAQRLNGQGSASRGGGSWINPLEKEEWRTNSRLGQLPPSGPRATAGYGSSSSGAGSISKKSRSEWIGDAEHPPNDSHRSNAFTSGGGFSSYSSNPTGYSAAQYQNGSISSKRPLAPGPNAYLTPRPPLSPSSSSPLTSPPIPAPRPQPLQSTSSQYISAESSGPSSKQDDRPRFSLNVPLETQSANTVKSPGLRVTIPNPNYRGERLGSNPNGGRPNTPILPLNSPNIARNTQQQQRNVSNTSHRDGGDTDEASLELNLRSDIDDAFTPIQSITANTITNNYNNNNDNNLPIYNKYTSSSSSSHNNSNRNRKTNSNQQKDDDEDLHQAERSSDLGLGMDTMEENFWEGVLNGDIDI